MKILRDDFVLKRDESFKIVKDGAFCFEEEIVDVGEFENISKRYKDVMRAVV